MRGAKLLAGLLGAALGVLAVSAWPSDRYSALRADLLRDCMRGNYWTISQCEANVGLRFGPGPLP